MKITKKQYEKAAKDLPKFKKAQEIVSLWEKGMEDVAEDRELLEVEESDLGFITTKTRRMEEERVDRERGRGAA